MSEAYNHGRDEGQRDGRLVLYVCKATGNQMVSSDIDEDQIEDFFDFGISEEYKRDFKKGYKTGYCSVINESV